VILLLHLPQIAGTEVGVKEPEATFSACFGAAFLMWHPMKVRRGGARWFYIIGLIGPGFYDADAYRLGSGR
jgi:hypothetical protein